MTKSGKSTSISEKLSESKSLIHNFITEVEKVANSAHLVELEDLIRSNKTEVLGLIPSAVKSLSQREEKLLKEIDNLKKENEQLRKDRDTVVSNNFLLEYKKKDLLLLADNLEEAYEEISAKNEELKAQKQQISEQSEALQKANEEILEKNRELEQQKEAILDQTDYLHEANETITAMHAEVQKQKDQILEKNEELINLNNEKNNLIGIVAHDLKSPLNQIKGLITLIKLTAEDLNEESLKYIDTIEQSAARLNEMIAKILDVESIESKKLNLNLEPVNLSELLTKCSKGFIGTAKAKNLEIHTEIEKDVYAKVDADYVHQVYENLLSNAIKFSPKNLKIFVTLKNEGNQAIAMIKDEGVGISASDMPKLFGKYQKLSARPTGNESSTGLGLSIVKKYVDAMEGKIWCESEENKGAAFYVAFDSVNA